MKKILFIAGISMAFVQCGKDSDPYLIKNGAVGNFSKEMKMKQVDSIFSNDSIVKLSSVKGAIGTQGEVEIYDKDGSKLLLLSPNDESSPDSEITNIQVFDPRYKTEKGLTPASTFKDVKANYTIDNIQTTINSVVVFLKDSDIYLTIDKKNLPEELRYNMDAKVEATQIPDEAKFKYFMIGWEPSSK
ncbi:hypothetical protein [Aequorivita echinoideorum]|nr:hypothetical protein [Aequorivita echinoideorum]